MYTSLFGVDWRFAPVFLPTIFRTHPKDRQISSMHQFEVTAHTMNALSGLIGHVLHGGKTNSRRALPPGFQHKPSVPYIVAVYCTWGCLHLYLCISQCATQAYSIHILKTHTAQALFSPEHLRRLFTACTHTVVPI